MFIPIKAIDMIKKYLMFSISIFFCLSLFSTVNGAGGKEDQLRLALLPIPSVLPIFVAEENGWAISEKGF